MTIQDHRGNVYFERIAGRVSKAAGSNTAFLTALVAVLIWAAAGPVFHFSQGWQLVINTGSSIVTFLMVFLIQKAQNKDSLAIQLKLNELISAHDLASNQLVNVETMTEDEMKIIQKYYAELSRRAVADKAQQKDHPVAKARKEMEERDKETGDGVNR